MIGKPVPAQIEHAVQVLVQDNLDLACAVVQKAFLPPFLFFLIYLFLYL